MSLVIETVCGGLGQFVVYGHMTVTSYGFSTKHGMNIH